MTEYGEPHSLFMIFVAFAGFLAFIIQRITTQKAQDIFGIKGVLAWKDEGKQTRPFFSQEYAIAGKPDLIYSTMTGMVAVEYKSRHGKVYESDILQARAAALAARGSGYDIRSIVVKTATKIHKENLPTTDHQLFASIEKYYQFAVRANSADQTLPAKANRWKCKSCAYANACQQRA